jgi:2-phosphoglycerate kinase
VLSVDDEKEHRSHFEIREVETEGMRPFARYLNNFDNIRKIQDYILKLATEQEVPVFPCYNIDQTIGIVLDFIINQVFVEYTNGRVEEGYVDRVVDAYAGREQALSQMQKVTEEGGKN